MEKKQEQEINDNNAVNVVWIAIYFFIDLGIMCKVFTDEMQSSPFEVACSIGIIQICFSAVYKVFARNRESSVTLLTLIFMFNIFIILGVGISSLGVSLTNLTVSLIVLLVVGIISWAIMELPLKFLKTKGRSTKIG